MPNCPCCGSEPMENKRYKFFCGSIQGHKRKTRYQSDICRISELKQRNEKLEAVATVSRDILKTHFALWSRARGTIKSVSWADLRKTLDALDKEPGDA